MTCWYVWTELVGAIIVVFFMGIFYEGLKTFREYLVYRDWKHYDEHSRPRRCHDDDDDDDSNDRHTFLHRRASKHKGY